LKNVEYVAKIDIIYNNSYVMPPPTPLNIVPHSSQAIKN